MKLLMIIVVVFICIQLLKCTLVESTNLMRFDEYRSTEAAVNMMAKMGVDHLNSKQKDGTYTLERVDMENIMTYGALEKMVEYKIETKKNEVLGYKKVVYDVNPSETKYLLDQKSLYDQIKLDEQESSELSLIADPSDKYTMHLVGPLKMNIHKEASPVFSLPKRLEVNSLVNQIELAQHAKIEISNINSIELNRPLRINTKNHQGLIHFEINEIPSVSINLVNKNLPVSFSTKEKAKLKINDRRKSAMIQSTVDNNVQSSSQLVNPSPLFTDGIAETYLEVATKLNNHDFKMTEITKASHKNIKLIQIPVLLKNKETHISSNHNIFIGFDQTNLYVTSVAPSQPSASASSLISYPSRVNETFAVQIVDFLSNNMRM